MDFEPIFRMPGDGVGAASLSSDIILAENTARGEQQREACAHPLVRRNVFSDNELALATDELADMHGRGAFRCIVVARPLNRALLLKHLEGDAGKHRGEPG